MSTGASRFCTKPLRTAGRRNGSECGSERMSPGTGSRVGNLWPGLVFRVARGGHHHPYWQMGSPVSDNRARVKITNEVFTAHLGVGQRLQLPLRFLEISRRRNPTWETVWRE